MQFKLLPVYGPPSLKVCANNTQPKISQKVVNLSRIHTASLGKTTLIQTLPRCFLSGVSIHNHLRFGDRSKVNISNLVANRNIVTMASNWNAENSAVKDMDAHVAASWEFFRSIGSPKMHVAPMVDQSELAFRQLCRKYGATCAYTPMLHGRIFSEDEKYRSEHFTTCPEDRPLFVQFCANDPDILLSAARLVEDRCDAVDLNLGCPQRIARKGNYGAFLMDDLPRVKALVEELYTGLKVPVTVKIRKFEKLEDTLNYALMLQWAGASVVAIHGRTREMKDASKFRADWEVIKAVKQALRVPVLGNGDLQTLEDCKRMMSETGVDGVLSAEPLLCNPALFSGADTAGYAPCDLLLEYLEEWEANPCPLRMVKGHAHKLLGEWFKEHWDLRDKLNLNKELEVETLREIAIELKKRIKESGRDHPIPRITARAQARLDAAARLEAAMAEQAREDHAMRGLALKQQNGSHSTSETDARENGDDRPGEQEQAEKGNGVGASRKSVLVETVPNQGVDNNQDAPSKKIKLDATGN